MFEVTGYNRYDFDEVMHLLQTGAYIHAHLDWRPLPAWLEDAGVHIRAARSGGRIAGCMLASAPYSGTSWLRLVAAADSQHLAPMLDALWLQIRRGLASCAVSQVGLLALEDWVSAYLPGLGFRPLNQVVTLMRDGPYLPPPLRADLTIRPARPEDMEAIREVDNAAFEPIWQYSTRDLQDAYAIAGHFTVSEMNRRIVGYLLSTTQRGGAHIARLATSPRLQGMGVGSMLLGETIEFFLRQKRRQITVNTQIDNHTSQQLYHRFGFADVGHSITVWHTRLTAPPDGPHRPIRR